MGIPKTTVYRHVARKYAEFGVDRPAVGAVLNGKASYGLANCYFSLTLVLQHAYFCIIITVLTEFR